MGTKLKEWLFPSNKKSEYNTSSVEINQTEINDEENKRQNPGVVANQAPRICKLNLYDNAVMAAEDLLNGKAVIVDLTDCEHDTARRIIDFLHGVSYSINGNIEKVAKLIYLFSPATK